jgi:hypothetical protein
MPVTLPIEKQNENLFQSTWSGGCKTSTRLLTRNSLSTGTFVIRTTGTFDGSAARSDWQIVPGSGTGGLRGILGSGTDVAEVAEAPHVRYTLRYRFA